MLPSPGCGSEVLLLDDASCHLSHLKMAAAMQDIRKKQIADMLKQLPPGRGLTGSMCFAGTALLCGEDAACCSGPKRSISDAVCSCV